MSSNEHQRAHDHITHEESAARQREAVDVKAQQTVFDEPPGFLQAIAAVAVGKRREVEAVAGAQGRGDAVVVVGIGVEHLLL